VLLTPPSFGLLRLLAERSLVVDFKLFPFGDRDMVSWFERLRDCYGQVASQGFDAAVEMDRHYHRIPDARLADIHRKYGASHAVLYAATRTNYPVLASTETLKLVTLSDTTNGGAHR